MNFKARNQSGFSVIELLLVLVVLVFVTVGGWWIAHKSAAHQSSANAAGYLKITQWHAKVPLTPTIADAYYTYSNIGTVTLSTHTLDRLEGTIKGCSSNLLPLSYERVKPGQRYAESAAIFEPNNRTLAYRLGDYYVFKVLRTVPACIERTGDVDPRIAPILDALTAQMSKIAPN